MRRKMIPPVVILTLILGLPLTLRAEKVPAAPAQKAAAAPSLAALALALAPAPTPTRAATCPQKLSQACVSCTFNSDCPQSNVCQVICDGSCCTCLWHW